MRPLQNLARKLHKINIMLTLTYPILFVLSYCVDITPTALKSDSNLTITMATLPSQSLWPDNHNGHITITMTMAQQSQWLHCHHNGYGLTITMVSDIFHISPTAFKSDSDLTITMAILPPEWLWPNNHNGFRTFSQTLIRTVFYMK